MFFVHEFHLLLAGGYMAIYTNRFERAGTMLIIVLALCSCQSDSKLKQETFYVDKTLHLDQQFPLYESIKIETQEEVFALDNQMRLMVKKKLMTERDIKKRSMKLLKHIFDQDNVALAYSSSANVSAIDAYHNQKANCLSLTIMAYALAKEADLDIKFQDVKIPEYWVRNGKYNMLTGHVNLVIIKPKNPNAQVVFGSNILTIDFDPFVVKKSFPKTIISQSYVLAMFYSNKGAQALVNKEYTKAYAYFRAATTTAPNFSAAWANLGILYRMNGYKNVAMKSYRYAVYVDAKNYTAMANLSLLLDDIIDKKELINIRKILKERRDRNPYYYALLADEAFYLGNNRQALIYFNKAIRLNKYAHEFYFGLAKVYYAMNENKKAQNAMSKAISYNRVESIDTVYLAKLNFLKKKE
jgi:tetratricopeptide (TPR) repeat protein